MGRKREREGELTKNVSPIIHDGALPPIESSKKAPIHCCLFNLPNTKSSGLIDHVLFPNEMAMLTSVVHAKKKPG